MIARRMMSGACGTCGGNVRAGILWENLRDRDYLEDIDKHGRVILKWI
jgi:ferredoxin